MGWLSERAARARTGWWRRNWWGLLAVLPLFAVAVWISPNDSYHTWRTSEPRQEQVAGADGWVSYGPVELRLVAFEPADLRSGAASGEPFPLPDGLRAWQTTLAITVPGDPDAYVNCDIELEDQTGRRYLANPDELNGAQAPDGPLGIIGCSTVDEDEAAAGVFETVAYFVMPRAAEPAAVRVTDRFQLPAYVRLEVG